MCSYYAQAIDGDWKQPIRSVCQDLERKTGVEMVVVTVPTIKPFGSANEYARRHSMKNGASDRRNKNMA